MTVDQRAAPDPAVTADDVYAAARAIEGAVVRTPASVSRTLSKILGAEVVLKFENLQFTASFKDRGALNKLLSLSPGARGSGVIAMSAGNHAQGVAYHAGRLGIAATIVMPRTTPYTKVQHTQGLGATVVLEGANLSESAAAAAAIAEKQGLVFVHPYDDPHIIAGQGTVGAELMEDFPDLDALVVPIGGGGLISGVALAARAVKPDIEIVGVQADRYPTMKAALEGKAVEAGGQTIAEGIAVKEPGRITRRMVAELVNEVVLVSESQIERAVYRLLEIEKTVAEGAGAAGLAALDAHAARYQGKRVGVVVSGGNIDSRVLASVILRGLTRDGRISPLRILIDDAPGSLARIAGIVAEHGANVVEVTHHRQLTDLSVKQAELGLVIETRDGPHADQVVASLGESGFSVERD